MLPFVPYLSGMPRRTPDQGIGFDVPPPPATYADRLDAAMRSRPDIPAQYGTMRHTIESQAPPTPRDVPGETPLVAQIIAALLAAGSQGFNRNSQAVEGVGATIQGRHRERLATMEANRSDLAAFDADRRKALLGLDAAQIGDQNAATNAEIQALAPLAREEYQTTHTPPKVEPPVHLEKVDTRKGIQLLNPVTGEMTPTGEQPYEPPHYASAGGGEKDTSKKEGDLRKEFAPLDKDFRDTHHLYSRAMAYKNSTAWGSNPADAGLVHVFWRMSSPNSRMGPQASQTVTEAQTMKQKMEKTLNKFLTGDKSVVLSPSQREQILTSIQAMYEASRADHNDLVAQYRDLAQTYQVNPDNVVRPWADESPTAGANDAASGQPDLHAIWLKDYSDMSEAEFLRRWKMKHGQ